MFRYKSKEFYEREPELKRALDQIRDGVYSPEDPNMFNDIVKHLLDWNDQWVSWRLYGNEYTSPLSYMLLADYAEYVKAQERVDQLYQVGEKKTKRMNSEMIFSLSIESYRMDEEMYFEHRRIRQVLLRSHDRWIRQRDLGCHAIDRETTGTWRRSTWHEGWGGENRNQSSPYSSTRLLDQQQQQQQSPSHSFDEYSSTEKKGDDKDILTKLFFSFVLFIC